MNRERPPKNRVFTQKPKRLFGAQASGSLVRVMPNYRSQELNLYAIYPSRQYLDAKIKTWVEYLRGSLPEILAGHQAELAAYEMSGSLGGARLAN
jgi:hypothetical protein